MIRRQEEKSRKGLPPAGAAQALDTMQQNPHGAVLGTVTIPAQGNIVNGAATSGNINEGAFSIEINNIGAFYNSSLTTDRSRISGGIPRAQAFIMLHELGHALGALMHDNIPGNPAASQAAVNANDKTLEQKCKKAIKGFR